MQNILSNRCHPVNSIVELGAFSLWTLAMESRVGAISQMQSGQKIQYLTRRIFRETYANELLIGQVAPSKGHLNPSKRYNHLADAHQQHSQLRQTAQSRHQDNPSTSPLLTKAGQSMVPP